MERNSRRRKKAQAAGGADPSTGHRRIIAVISVEFVKSCSVQVVKSRETG